LHREVIARLSATRLPERLIRAESTLAFEPIDPNLNIKCSEPPSMNSQNCQRMKELEAENAGLRRAVSDLPLDKMILAEATKP
jgi:hypothetical protein